MNTSTDMDLTPIMNLVQVLTRDVKEMSGQLAQTGTLLGNLTERVNRISKTQEDFGEALGKVRSKEARAGMIKPTALLTAVSVMLGIILAFCALSSAWTTMATDCRAQTEKVAYLERQLERDRSLCADRLDLERRLVRSETLITAAIHHSATQPE